MNRRLESPKGGYVHSAAGGALVIVLGVVTVLSLIAATVLKRTAATYNSINQVATWQESVTAAEAGADFAMAALRRTINDPDNAFSGWTTRDSKGVFLPNSGRRYVLPTLVRKGEGSNQLDAEVLVDAPSELLDNGQQWYRIRSMGTAYLSGVAYASSNRRDNVLRKLSFFWNPRRDRAVSRPQASRLVELVVKPVGFENAIVSDLPMNLNNYKIVVDSYDSRDDSKSTNGLYDPAKMQENGDIATNSQLIDAGSAHIYGDAYTNAGVVNNGANIEGEQRTDFYQELLPIDKPSWLSITVLPTAIVRSATLVGGTKATPARYKFTGISLSGNEVLTIAPMLPGVESYVEIWLTGDLSATGSGSIKVQPNTNLKIFIEGQIDIKGNGTFNANSQPARLQILGVKPSNGSTPRMSFSGNGVFVGAVYAPNHDIQFGSTGSDGTYWGSLIGRSVTMGGSSTIHYDEALSDQGYITDYRIQSWFEDNSNSTLVPSVGLLNGGN